LVKAAAALVALLGTSAAYADGITLDHLEVSDRGSRFFAADSLDLQQRPQLTTGVVTTYQHAMRVFGTPAEGARTTLVADQLTFHPGASFVFLPGLRVALDMPFVVQSGHGQSLAGTFYRAPESPQLGDLRLGIDGRFFSTNKEGGDGVVLAGGLWLWLPTGSRADYTSDGAFRTGVRVSSTFQKGVFLGAAKLGITYRRDDVDPFGGVRVGSELNAVLAAGWHDGPFTVGPEVHAITILRDAPFSHRASPMEGILGAHAEHKRWLFGLGVGTALDRGLGAPGIRVLGSVEFTPIGGGKKCEERPLDRDGDGIPDAEDACPLMPGVRTTNPATNGCADRDGDGLPDPIDACPLVAGPRSNDPKKDGCPPDPAPPPPPPLPPPPPDRDADNIPDAEDACPDEPGDPSPDPQVNGCAFVKRVGDKLTLMQPIGFEAKRPVLTVVGERAVNALAAWLTKHPEVVRLRIETHAEKLGPLTQQQADAVVERLVSHGVELARLEPKGMGGAPGVSRRVELRVVGIP
jgi:outer membrane protein OmpA-like peptidoglycan-associated protein